MPTFVRAPVATFVRSPELMRPPRPAPVDWLGAAAARRGLGARFQSTDLHPDAVSLPEGGRYGLASTRPCRGNHGGLDSRSRRNWPRRGARCHSTLRYSGAGCRRCLRRWAAQFPLGYPHSGAGCRRCLRRSAVEFRLCHLHSGVGCRRCLRCSAVGFHRAEPYRGAEFHRAQRRPVAGYRRRLGGWASVCHRSVPRLGAGCRRSRRPAAGCPGRRSPAGSSRGCP